LNATHPRWCKKLNPAGGNAGERDEMMIKMQALLHCTALIDMKMLTWNYYPLFLHGFGDNQQAP
jgi:hypothetical protein